MVNMRSVLCLVRTWLLLEMNYMKRSSKERDEIAMSIWGKNGKREHCYLEQELQGNMKWKTTISVLIKSEEQHPCIFKKEI